MVTSVERVRRWRAANPERARASYRARYWKNLEKNPEEFREMNAAAKRRAYAANPKRSNAASRKWQAANPERLKASSAAWRAANPDKLKATNAAWRAANPDKVRAKVSTQRARRQAAFVEVVNPSVIFERDGGICQLCGEPIGDLKWHVDHRIPLARGGDHSYANTQLAHARCNLVKGVKVTTPAYEQAKKDAGV